MVVHVFKPRTRETETNDLYEFEDSQGYGVMLSQKKCSTLNYSLQPWHHQPDTSVFHHQPIRSIQKRNYFYMANLVCDAHCLEIQLCVLSDSTFQALDVGS